MSNLKTGESIALKDTDGSECSRIAVGLGWDSLPEDEKKTSFLSRFKPNSEIDLDASVLSFSVSNQFLDMVYFGKTMSSDASTMHLGDNRDGNHDTLVDNEQILINLDEVTRATHHLVIVVSSYGKHSFDELQNVFCRIVLNGVDGQELFRYNLNEFGEHTGQIMGILSRSANGWEFEAVGVPCSAKNPKQLIETASELI